MIQQWLMSANEMQYWQFRMYWKWFQKPYFLDDQIHSLSYMIVICFFFYPPPILQPKNKPFHMTSKIKHTPYWVVSILKVGNWHIQWNENLALELSYDLGLGCSPLFSNSTDYDSSYPWIRLRFVHLMGVRPVQTYC